MRRLNAKGWYFFGDAYFDRILSSPDSWLVMTYSPTGEPVAGVVVVKSDGMLHSYLSGTATEYVPAAPVKNAFAASMDLAVAMGLPLNLGGGTQPGDSLEHFKMGFANATAPFHTQGIICDRERYAALSHGTDETTFFPAYRWPLTSAEQA